MQDIVGVPGEDTAYRDAKVRKRMSRDILAALGRRLLPGETVLGIFAAYRLRRSVSALVVTDQRLLTLGDVSVGMPVVDEVDRSQVSEVRIERQKMFSLGAVVALTAQGETGLGTLDYGKETFNKLEEVLERHAGAGMPLIPTPGRPGAEPAPTAYRSDDPAVTDDPVVTEHPLVAHLRSLAELHERGSLTDQEFAEAKQKLLAQS